jgi:hypothetical protein
MELAGHVVAGALLGWCWLAVAASSPLRADYPSSVLDDVPLGYWRLNDSPGSPASNLGTGGEALEGSFAGQWPGAAGPSELADGTPLFGLRNNVAFDVGAADAYVEVEGSPMSGLTEFTLSGWFNIRGLDADRLGLFGQNDVVELGFSQPDQLQLWTAKGGSITWTFDPSSDLPTGAWFHVAAVGTGESLGLYINGASVATGGTAITTDYGSSALPFRIGGDIFDEGGDRFRGTLDEVAFWNVALSADQVTQHFQAAIGALIPGDFNGNGGLDVDDVNLLQLAIYEGSDDLLYDVDGNAVIDDDDLIFWVNDLAFTWIGDANLDGVFNSSDFVQVLAAGQYEDNVSENSTWDTGDWNSDLEFNSADLVTALAYGGYELPPPGATPVPEPTTIPYLAAVLWLIARRRRKE